MTEIARPQPLWRGAFTRAMRVMTVLRVGSMAVRLHPSCLIAAGLAIWVFATRFPALLWAYGLDAVIASTVVTVVLFLGSVAVHQAAHVGIASDRNISVRGVTLFLLGDLLEHQPGTLRPRDEATMVAAGPFASLALASAFGLVHSIAPGQTPFGVVTGYLAWANVALAVFNLLPFYPLDGGRLLRAGLRGAGIGRYRATRWSAMVGLGAGMLLSTAGLYGLLGGPLPLVSGPALYVVLLVVANGTWGVVVGLVLTGAAWQAWRRVRWRERLASYRVVDVVEPLPPSLPPDLPVAHAAGRLRERPETWWPVGSPLTGVVRLDDADAVAPAARLATRLQDLATGADEVTIEADGTLDEAVDRLTEAPGQMLIAMEDGRPVGLLTLRRVGRLTR